MVLSVIGHGYVGLATATVFADLGNTVWVIGRNPKKIEKLKKGIIPFFEPDLSQLVKRNLKAGRLKFTLDYKEAISESAVIFIAVGTPPSQNGEADLSAIFEVARKIGKYLTSYTVVATKSTVPPGTNRQIKTVIENQKGPKVSFDIVSTPEFLSQGTAIENTLHPDRVVIGVESERAKKILLELHQSVDGRLVLTNLETAEMIKYAANTMLATKISFANTIALLCEKVGADALKVLEGVGLDKRIGEKFLHPGVGFGGSCLPKDIKALIKIGEKVGFPLGLFQTVYEANEEAKESFVQKVKSLLGGQPRDKTIGVLGLAFKPDTDDMREAPSIYIIRALQEVGARIGVYDPVAMENAKQILRNITYYANPYEVARNADILLIVTEWEEFKRLDLARIKKLMERPIVLDGRNIYDPEKMKKLGFLYQGVGR